MGNITNDTFNPLRAYCNVRLQQGVPLVDADVNELDDIRKFEVRAFLKWFVGNGVPDGNDGFRIVATGSATDFTISAGLTPNTTTTTSAQYTQPANGASVPVTVATTTGMAPLQHVAVVQSNGTFAGLYQIASVGGPTSVTLTKLASGGGVSVGSIVTAAANVFQAGPTIVDTGLGFVGRIIVDGLDVIIPADKSYVAQPLSAIDLAAPYSVPALGVIPNVVGPVLVYLDIWERIVSSAEDPSLMVQPLNMETCARIKRLWIVRTRAGASVPVQGDADFRANHLYYPLASINRNGNAPIHAGDITDLREQGLSILSSNLLQDTLGETPAQYRKGLGRPAMSLRDAINALLHGQLPGTAEQPVVTNFGTFASSSPRAFFFDGANGVVAMWSEGPAFHVEVFGARLDLANPGAGFDAKVQLASDSLTTTPSAVVLPNGDLFLVYVANSSGDFGDADVYYKRASSLATLAAAAPLGVATDPDVAEILPLAVLSGDYVIIFLLSDTTWGYRLFFHPNNNFADAGIQPIPAATGDSLHAAAGSPGFVWVAFTSPAGVSVFRLNVATTGQDQGASFAGANYDPFVVVVGAEVWVFWRGSSGIMFAHYGGSWSVAAQVPGTVAGDSEPMAVPDGTGHLAVVFTRTTALSILVVYLNIATGTWGLPLMMSGSSVSETTPILLAGPNKVLWFFWSRAVVALAPQIFYKQVFAAL